MDGSRPEHLTRYARVEAVEDFDDETRRAVVWENNDRDESVLQTLFVHVPSLGEKCLGWLRAKIADYVPEGARRA
jgi:hypothetical protein